MEHIDPMEYAEALAAAERVLHTPTGELMPHFRDDIHRAVCLVAIVNHQRLTKIEADLAKVLQALGRKNA